MVRISLFRFLSLAAIMFLLISLLLTVVYAEEDSLLLPENTEVLPPIILDDPKDFRQAQFENGLVIVSPPVREVAPVTPSDTSGLKAILLSLFGNYDPVIVEYSYTNSQGYVSYVRDIEPDYVWMISAAVFVIVLYCSFRILGAVIKK